MLAFVRALSRQNENNKTRFSVLDVHICVSGKEPYFCGHSGLLSCNSQTDTTK